MPVRHGVLPAGAEEVVAECGGRAVLVGADAASAAEGLAGLADEVQVWETEGYRPAAWAAALAPVLVREPVVVLPASADGRDLAPRLAHRLGRPLLAGAIEVTADRVVIARWGGLAVEDVVPPAQLVATLQPGVRGFARAGVVAPTVVHLDLPSATGDDEEHPAGTADATVLEVLPPDPATMDLAEAPRIVAGGAGPRTRRRGSRSWRSSAEALGASLGATRVVTDRGWVGHERQIGTTGVVVDPRLYLAFGISGAVQHTSGLGQPDHVISVNTDASCPMMQLADLAVVSDANAVLDELRRPGRPRPGTRGPPVPDVDVIVVGAGPAGATRGADPGAGRAQRRAARARTVPRLQEHVRRGRLPADPRRAHPAVVGGGADPAVGHAALDHGADRTGRRSPSTTAPRPGARRPTTAPPPTGRTSTPGWPARPRPKAPALVCSTTVTGLLRDGRTRASACAPTGPTAT